MKGYQEFKGYRTRIDYDSQTKSFTVRKLVISEMTALTKDKNRKGNRRSQVKSAKGSIEPMDICGKSESD